MVAIASAPVAFKPALLQQKSVRASRAQRVVVRASSNKIVTQDSLVKSAAFASVATSFLAAGNAQAAMEVANIAAGDTRAGLLLLPLGAAFAWVGINILPGLKNQLDAMADKNAKSVAAGLGLGAASLLAARGADAAEIMELAAGDNRAGLLLLPLGAAFAWVGINILPGLKNQIDAMSDKNSKSIAAGLGLTAASLLAAQGADAAEIMELAAGDNRAGLLVLPLTAALGWVAINILPGLKNQIDAMADKNAAIVTGLGLSAASLLVAQNADAATEIMDLAAGDNRFGPVLGIFALVLGWVGFNMAGPTLNQLDSMSAKNKK